MSIVRMVCTKRVVMTFFSIVASAGGIRYALIPHTVLVHCDPRCAPPLQAPLKSSIENMSIRSLGATGILRQLEADYPFVESVTIAYRSSLKAVLYLDLYKPLLLLVASIPGQREYVLCRGGKVFEKRFYNDGAVHGLPKIIIEGSFEEKRKDAALIGCALQLHHDTLEDYTITWRSKSDICLQYHDAPIILSADEITIHDKERYAYVHRIFTKENECYKEGIKADIRLPDEIVCSPLGK